MKIDKKIGLCALLMLVACANMGLRGADDGFGLFGAQGVILLSDDSLLNDSNDSEDSQLSPEAQGDLIGYLNSDFAVTGKRKRGAVGAPAAKRAKKNGNGEVRARPFKCEFEGCSYKATVKRLLNQHKEVHLPKNIPCEFKGCSFLTNAKRRLKPHYMSMHAGENPYRCEFEGCSFLTNAKRRLKPHYMSMHTGEKPYRCEFEGCEYATAKNNRLQEHIRTHTGEKPYRCEFEGCSYATAQSSNLSTHMKKKHVAADFDAFVGGLVKNATAPAPAIAPAPAFGKRKRGEEEGGAPASKRSKRDYACYFEGCEYAAAQNTHLQEHIRTHTGEKPYRCEFEGCNYGSVHLPNLKRHMRTHSREKPAKRVKANLGIWKCGYAGCSYTGSVSAEVEKHMKLHNV